ncbi:hypothetical protein DMENIID0001_159820 [Sergentomyia squamirostris]
MPPNVTSSISSNTRVLNKAETETVDGVVHLKAEERRQSQFNWFLIIVFSILHISALYGVWLMVTSAKFYTIFFAYFLYVISTLGVTAGAHRLWSHRSYKAKLPLRIILMIFHTFSFQFCIMQWAREHRVHHKYSDTDADPHNASRGFFFSHIGWVFCKQHPDFIAKESLVDTSDLEADFVVRFQDKYYTILIIILCYILPTITPMYFWDESIINSWFVATMFRLTFSLNMTFLINSAAHTWGHKPYDEKINPSENLSVAFLALGEGWHNYHHTFPWDYKAAELGNYRLNFATAFIDFFAKIGWAYDLKTVSTDIIKKRVKRTGDGTHNLWGWGDKDQDQMEVDNAVIINRKKD